VDWTSIQIALYVDWTSIHGANYVDWTSIQASSYVDWRSIQGLNRWTGQLCRVNNTPTAIVHIIKKDRFKMAAVVGLSTSRSEYFVRKECM